MYPIHYNEIYLKLHSAMLKKFHTLLILLVMSFKLNQKIESAKEHNLDTKERKVEKIRDSSKQQAPIYYLKQLFALFR